MRPAASTTGVSGVSRRSISARAPVAWIRPSRMSIAPLGMMARSRISGPMRGRGGPARVTSCRELRTARSGIRPTQAGLDGGTDGFVLHGSEVDIDVLARAGLGGGGQGFGDRQIGCEL